MRTVLTEVLDPISAEEQVRFIGYGNTIKISTHTDLNSKLYTRVYDVADLISKAHGLGHDGPDFGVRNLGMAGGMGGGMGGGGFGGGGFGGGGMGGGGFGGGGGGFGGGGMGGGGFGGGGGGFGGGSGGGSGGEGNEEESVEERMDKLIELVTNTIEPRVVGG